MITMNVIMLGGFEIIVGQNRHDLSLSKSKKGWMLAKYLFFHKSRSVSNAELIEVLWPGETYHAHENALKTSISRMRSFFTEIDPRLNRLILTGDSCYFVNPEIEVQVDALRFLLLGERLSSASTLTEEVRGLFDEFFSIYRGIFLPADGRDGDGWVNEKREMLSALHLRTLYSYLALLKKNGDDEALLAACREALEIVAYDEQLQQIMMETLHRTRRSTEARLQSFRERDGHSTGTAMSNGMKSYYHKIHQLGRTLEMDIDKIRGDLIENAQRRGAFFCEYNFFKDIQYIQKRHLERLGTSLFIALIALSAQDDDEIEPKVLMESMDSLKAILLDCLRMGDTVAQHGAGQYVVLLPTANDETGNMIMKRIISAFEEKNLYSRVKCGYTVSPIL